MILMKSLNEEIQDILVPRGLGLVKENKKIYQLQPLMPVSQYLELIEDLDESGKDKFVSFLFSEGTVVFNGVIYLSIKPLNLSGRLKEILTVYYNHIKEVVGEKQALLDLYEKVSAQDIANLTQNNVIFVMKKLHNQDKKALAAIRYFPEYNIYFEKLTFKMPSCVLAIHIDKRLNTDSPEVISEDKSQIYEHPFVYRDYYNFGQKICMGSFYNSEEQKQFNKLRFANTINNLMKQSVQILISGYNRSVTPANDHLNHPKYRKYIKK